VLGTDSLGLTEAEPTISDRIKALFDADVLKY
jgi:hypothetical protein